MSKNIILEKLVESAMASIMETNFLRIKQGKQLDITNKPYDMQLIENMISYYESGEEYEKCNIVLEFKNKKMDHENNYKNCLL